MSREQIETVYKDSWDSAKKVGDDPFQLLYVKNVVDEFASGKLPSKLSDVKTFVSIGHGKVFSWSKAGKGISSIVTLSSQYLCWYICMV